jgi:hypothetical protein
MQVAAATRRALIMTRMSSLPAGVLREGSATPSPDVLALRAGPLSLELTDGMLRYVSHGEHEVLRRLHVAVRDQHWDTVPGVIVTRDVRVEADAFQLTLDGRHRRGDIDVEWRGTVRGDSDGTLTFLVDLEARSTFLRNRIGLVILHPQECAGARCHALHTDGSYTGTIFPTAVTSAQPLDALQDLAGLSHEVVPDLWAELRFQGDEFETEDQRNWIDASFKTYSTPLRVPYPVRVVAGSRIQQSVVLRLIDERKTKSATTMAWLASTSARATIQLEPDPGKRLPALGLGLASHQEPLGRQALARLSHLRPAHLRVDLHASAPDWPGALARANSSARALDTHLEVALFADDDRSLPRIASECVKLEARIARWLAFDETGAAASPEWFESARQILRPLGAPVGSGTNGDLYDLRDSRLERASYDLITFSINPQVHATDRAALAEALTAIPHTLAHARTRGDGRPVVVSPVTFKPRGNPAANARPSSPNEDGLPAEVDPRQMSLFGAAWTLGALIALAAGQAQAVTLFETTGWLGVMERSSGSPLPQQFRSVPDGVFPLYHVLADFADFVGGRLIPLAARTPAEARTVVAALLTDGANGTTLLIANLSRYEQFVESAFAPRARWRRSLTEDNAEAAMREPEEFRLARVASEPTTANLTLRPFEYLRLDL